MHEGRTKKQLLEPTTQEIVNSKQAKVQPKNESR